MSGREMSGSVSAKVGSLVASANSPRTGRQLDCTTGIGRNRIAQAFADRIANRFIAAGKIIGSRALSGEERLPVFLEICESGCYIERAHSDVCEGGACE